MRGTVADRVAHVNLRHHAQHAAHLGRPYAVAYNCAMADASSTDPLAWRTRKAPSLEAFEEIAAEAFRRLPQTFRALCEGVVIRVEDFPTEEVLNELKAQTEFDLLGLFQGVGLPFRSESAPV